jgi:hypothetical protein
VLLPADEGPSTVDSVRDDAEDEPDAPALPSEPAAI